MNNQEIYQDKKYILGIDYGNDKSIQVVGTFKVNIHALFKKRKVGKKYKYYKTKYIEIIDIRFIGERVISNEQ